MIYPYCIGSLCRVVDMYNDSKSVNNAYISIKLTGERIRIALQITSFIILKLIGLFFSLHITQITSHYYFTCYARCISLKGLLHTLHCLSVVVLVIVMYLNMIRIITSKILCCNF